MVVQRSWKIQGDVSTSAASTASTKPPLSAGGANSSSEDSNGSNQTTHSIATSLTSSASHKVQDVVVVPPNVGEAIKLVTTPQMAENMLLRLRQRLCPPVVGANATSEAVMRSLELLRINVQSIFDKEIDVVVKKFMDTYFKPAFNNIKENMGKNSISDDMLQKMTCVLLENSKSQYSTARIKANIMQASAQSIANNKMLDVSTPLRIAGIKRAAPKAGNAIELVKKVNPLPIQSINAAATVASKTTAQSTEGTVRKVTVAQPRRQIFWNTANICTNTNFVLDVQANQAFGFGTDGKERLASKHPELIRYLPDGEDRDWLIAQNIISQQNRNSRFLFLIYDEVFKLYQNNDLYKKKPNISMAIMHTFKVPEFMIQKMKLFFVDLNIKSRGLITNSFCTTTTVQNQSHLRNALLQGAQNSSISTSNLEPCCTTTSTVVSSAVANSVSTSTETTATATSKTKPSTLSSSHATLTALLNNSASNNAVAPIVRTNSISGRSSVTYSSDKTVKKPTNKPNF